MTKTGFSQFTFKNDVKGNDSDHNARLGSRLINKVERFEYLGVSRAREWGES